MQQALRIYKGHSKSAPKIAECNHLTGRVKCLEGHLEEGDAANGNQQSAMDEDVQPCIKLAHIIRVAALPRKQVKLARSISSYIQKNIEKIVETCFCYKAIWAFRKIVTIVLDRELNCYTSLTIQHLQ